MSKDEPPAMGKRSMLFKVGRNSRGHWVVEDQSGLRGGLFVDRVEAMKFAMFETGNRPQAVIMVPGIFELDLSGKPAAARDPAAGDQAAAGRRHALARAA